MNADELFTRALAVLPGAVRERLGEDFPIDWPALEDASTGADLGEAVRLRRRLPEKVESLVHRLIRDVGIVPADLAAGVERQGVAGAWIHWVTIEADGESYQMRNDRTGDVHTGIRPEAVAGYAALGMELATALHQAAQRWREAGEHHRATAENERSQLAQCAVHMHEHLHAQPHADPAQRTAASLARTLEYAWNTQSVEVRAALSSIRLSTARGACAPRRSHYAPVIGYRLHACDAGEIRWLRALAERAGAGRPDEGAGESHSGARAAGNPAPGRATTARDTGVTAPGHKPERSAAGMLELGSAPDTLNPDSEVAELERAVKHVPGAVRRRMGEAHGTGVAEVLERFGNPRAVDALRNVVGPAASKPGARAPRWLERLAAALLMETGAQTREGARTSSVRLDPERDSDGAYRATDIETGATARPHAHRTGRAGPVESRVCTRRMGGADGVAKRRQGGRLGAERSAQRKQSPVGERPRDARGRAGRRTGARTGSAVARRDARPAVTERSRSGRDGGGGTRRGGAVGTHRHRMAWRRAGAECAGPGGHRKNRGRRGTPARGHSCARQSAHRGMGRRGSAIRRKPERIACAGNPWHAPAVPRPRQRGVLDGGVETTGLRAGRAPAVARQQRT